MAFQLLIKNSNGTLDTTHYPSGIINRWLKFSIGYNIVGGCLGYTLPISRPFRTAFDFVANQIIEVYWNDALIHSGFIQGEIKKDVDKNEHTYTVHGFWDKLANVVLDEEIILGSASTSNPTINTIGKVIGYLADKMVTQGVGVNKNLSKIVCTVPISSLTIHANTDVYTLLQQLRVMAMSDGQCYAVGVDGAKDLFFQPVSNLNVNLQSTMTVGTNCLQSTEMPATALPVNNLIVVSEKIPTKGQWFKKSYRDTASLTNHTLTKPYPVRVNGITLEADANNFKTGFFNVYANPTVSVCDISYKPDQTASIAYPWLGQFKYVDSARSLTIQDYSPSIEVNVGSYLSYTIHLGQTAAANSDNIASLFAANGDKFSPTMIDKLTSSKEKDDIASYPDVTDLVDAPTGYPCEMGPSIPLTGSNIGSLGGGGSTTTLTKGEVVELNASGGSKIGDIIRWVTKFSNGGTAFDVNSAPVKFHYKLYSNTGTLIALW